MRTCSLPVWGVLGSLAVTYSRVYIKARSLLVLPLYVLACRRVKTPLILHTAPIIAPPTITIITTTAVTIIMTITAITITVPTSSPRPAAKGQDGERTLAVAMISSKAIKGGERYTYLIKDKNR